jgi:hypothetical protein
MRIKGTWMSETKDLLFDQYSWNLALYLPEWKERFACPLCLRLFTRAEIDQLSVEHIVPSSIGGNVLTLTCTECNNRHGSKLDAHLINRLRAEDKLTGRNPSGLRGVVTTGLGSFTAWMRISPSEDSPLSFIGIPKHSDPKLLQLAMDELAAGPTKIRFQVARHSAVVVP